MVSDLPPGEKAAMIGARHEKLACTHSMEILSLFDHSCYSNRPQFIVGNGDGVVTIETVIIKMTRYCKKNAVSNARYLNGFIPISGCYGKNKTRVLPHVY